MITIVDVIADLNKIDNKYMRLYQGKLISHYTNIDSLISIISKDQLWASNAMFLNDQSEIIHLKKVIKIVIEENYPKNDINEFTKWIMEKFDSVINQISKNTFITSFSTEQDSLPLWSGYTSNDAYSMNLSYDDVISNININIYNNSQSQEKHKTLTIYGLVVYDDSTKAKIVNEYLKICYNILKKTPLRNIKEVESNKWVKTIIKSIFTRLFMIALVTKDECFKSEKEFRFIFNIDIKLNPSLLNFRNSGGLLIPYIKVNSLFKNNKLPIASITIGPRNNVEKAKIGFSDFLQSKGYSKIDFVKSKIPLRY